MLNERSKSEKAKYYMIITILLSGRGKTTETTKRSVMVRGKG